MFQQMVMITLLIMEIAVVKIVTFLGKKMISQGCWKSNT